MPPSPFLSLHSLLALALTHPHQKGGKMDHRGWMSQATLNLPVEASLDLCLLTFGSGAVCHALPALGGILWKIVMASRMGNQHLQILVSHVGVIPPA